MSHPDPERRTSAAPGSERLLVGLTPEQAQAVTHGGGPLLLIAGPGAGKTRTLTHRIAYLLESEQAHPDQILAVTFSVRAAGELRLRLADLLGQERARRVTAATFHSVCARLLREHAHVFGRTEHYTIYDQGDMRRVLDWLLSDKERASVQAALGECRQPASAEVQSALSLAKNELLSPESIRSRLRYQAAELIAVVWKESELELRRSNAWDFDDLLEFGVRLLREHPQRLHWIRSRWRWLLVDEFQDVNRAQAELVFLLAGADGNVTIVADQDQVVHSFRGADPRHIVEFAKHYPRHGAIVLGRNFRSRGEILAAATRCVQHNQRRVQKQLVAVRGGGGIVEVRAFYEDWHEAHWVAGQVAEAIDAGIPGPEIAQAFEEQHGRPASLGEFLEHAAGLHAQELGAGEDRRVTVSTIHRAKGTEATLVILVGCEEQLLPSWQSLCSPDPEALCEERRLFYVAATRAKDRLILTHVRTRAGRDTAGPSRFLYEAGLLSRPTQQAA